MFITFEGIDASGKTTQLGLLEKELGKKGYDILITRQPGGTSIGQKLRDILLDPENNELFPESEMLLYVADRIQHIKEVIQPALDRGMIVLCDRYHDATLAYQGGGRQLDLDWLQQLQEKHIISPDLTIWFDISVENSQKRLQERNKTQDTENCRLEGENKLFFDRVRAAYDRMCREETNRYVRIDAEGDIQTVHRQVVDIVINRLG